MLSALILPLALLVAMLTVTSGILLAVHLLRGRSLAWSASLAHGGLALVCILMLGFGILPSHAQRPGQVAVIALAFLLAAALSGLYPAWHHKQNRRPVFEVLFVHAALGVVAFATLLALAF